MHLDESMWLEHTCCPPPLVCVYLHVCSTVQAHVEANFRWLFHLFFETRRFIKVTMPSFYVDAGNQTQVIGLAAGILPTSHLPSSCIFHFTKYWQTVLQSGYTNWDFHQIFKCFLVWWKKTGHLFLASKKKRLYLVIYNLSNKFLCFISFIKLRKITSKNKLLENLLLSSFKGRNM